MRGETFIHEHFDHGGAGRNLPAALSRAHPGTAPRPGHGRLQPLPRPFTAQELAEALKDTDIVVTHWGTPQIDACMLDGAPRLRLLAHAAGTVAHIASEAFYERNIPVLSANSVMARFVAESVLGYMIAATHRVAQLNASIRAGSWDKRLGEQTSLFGNSIGLIGLGTVGRELLSLLAPFGCTVRVYDPYLPTARWSAGLSRRNAALKRRCVSPL